MKQKNLYFYTNLLAWGLVLLLIGNYVFGWTTPSGDPPGSNLPAPINVGSTEQTKAGNLIIGGSLTTGSFTMLAGAGENKVLTTNASGVATWQTAGGGWDGILPNYTTPQRNALSLVDGLIVYNTTDNAVQIYKSGAWANVGAKLSLAATCSLDGDCDSTHCVDGVCCDTVCSGTICQTCGLLSSNGLGHCGYVNSSSNDPRNTCTTASPGVAGSCKNPNCNGTGYACGYLSNEAGQPTCKRCTGSSYDPVNIANGSQDTEGSNLCTAAHYRCDGAGACSAPTYNGCFACPVTCATCVTHCANWGFISAVNTSAYAGCGSPVTPYSSCSNPTGGCTGYKYCICNVYTY